MQPPIDQVEELQLAMRQMYSDYLANKEQNEQ